METKDCASGGNDSPRASPAGAATNVPDGNRGAPFGHTSVRYRSRKLWIRLSAGTQPASQKLVLLPHAPHQRFRELG